MRLWACGQFWQPPTSYSDNIKTDLNQMSGNHEKNEKSIQNALLNTYSELIQTHVMQSGDRHHCGGSVQWFSRKLQFSLGKLLKFLPILFKYFINML